MINQSTLRYFFIIIIVLILLSLGFIYIFSAKIAPTLPYQTLTPEVYEKGTVVDLYRNTPPGFPKEVILEDKELDYSGTVTSPQGKVQMSLSYISSKTMREVANLYKENLPLVDWVVAEKHVYAKTALVIADKGNEHIIITISPYKEGETKVTFQYEK